MAESDSNALAQGYIDTCKQAFANKLQRGSFSVDDLIRLASVIGCRVALLSDDGKTFVFNPSDAAPPRRSGFASIKASAEDTAPTIKE